MNMVMDANAAISRRMSVMAVSFSCYVFYLFFLCSVCQQKNVILNQFHDSGLSGLWALLVIRGLMISDIDGVERFIVVAKSQSYVAGGLERSSSRPVSHDIGYENGAWRYLDSYFRGTDFAGQETIWRDDEPVWAMNYYGTVLRTDLIDARRAGAVIQAALGALYGNEQRFLGGWNYAHHFGDYADQSDGDFRRFTGFETITVGGLVAYRLHYHGGLITP